MKTDGCLMCCAEDILLGKSKIGSLCDGCASTRPWEIESERIVASACYILGYPVFTAKSHSECFMSMRSKKIHPDISRKAEQGFLTDRGRFVGRKEAAFIALWSGQIRGELLSPSTWLTSEDLCHANKHEHILEIENLIKSYPTNTAIIRYQYHGIVKDWVISANSKNDTEETLRKHLVKWNPSSSFICCVIK